MLYFTLYFFRRSFSPALTRQKQQTFFVLCLVFSAARADASIGFGSLSLAHLKNATAFETLNNQPMITLPMSVSISYAIWYGACRVAGFVTGRAYSHWKRKPADTDFCSQLASTIMLTEVSLFSHIQPSIFDRIHWKLIRFLTGLGVIYFSYTAGRDLGAPFMPTVPVAFLAYLSGEAAARMTDELTTSLMFEQTNITGNTSTVNSFENPGLFSLISGILLAGCILEVALKMGLAPNNPTGFFVLSFVAAESYSTQMASRNESESDSSLVFRGKGAFIAFLAMGSALTTCTVINKIQHVLGGTSLSEDVARVFSGFGAVATGGAAGIANIASRNDVNVSGLAGVLVSSATAAVVAVLTAKVIARFGAGARQPATRWYSKPVKPIFAALTFAVITSFLNQVTYGQSIEKSLSDISRTLLKKCYTPSEYLESLFPWPL